MVRGVGVRGKVGFKDSSETYQNFAAERRSLPPPIHPPLTMSSREIAERTEKEHKNVIRDIRVLLEELGDGSTLSHVREEKDARGYTACFHLPKDLTITLVAGYSAPLRHRIVTRWM